MPIYLFCKSNIIKNKLEKTSKIQILKLQLATHSTIEKSQHREFLTFLTSFSIYCFNTAHVYLIIYVTL